MQPTPTTRRRPRRLRRGLAALTASVAVLGLGLTVVPGPDPAAADPEWGTVVRLKYSKQDGNTGDLPMPDCGSKNITGDWRIAVWEIRSELPSGAKVLPGTEWDVEVEMSSAWSGGMNDGPDPLVVEAVPTGPKERAGAVEAEYGTSTLQPYDAHWGPGATGPLHPVGDWGYAFDANSSPGYMDGSDGVNLTMRYTLRATTEGEIKLPKLQLSGHDGTPPAGAVSCSVPLNWYWTVLPPVPPVLKGEHVKADATYSEVVAGDRSGGSHGIDIDVLANDDDPNHPDGPGDLDRLRLTGWSPGSTQGGYVSCGTNAQAIADPTTTLWEDLATGPCTYEPPQDFVGVDTFSYDVVQRNGLLEETAQVTIVVSGNNRPVALPASFTAPQDEDVTRTLDGKVLDANDEPLVCSTLPGEPVTPAVGEITFDGDCDFLWDNQDPSFEGEVTFGYRVCDRHQTLKAKGQLGAAATPRPGYHLGWPDDLDANRTSLCREGTATIDIAKGFSLAPPPADPKDLDIVLPTDPTDPADPEDPADPTHPEDPADPTHPDDPADPDDPTKPDDPRPDDPRPEDPRPDRPRPDDPTQPDDPKKPGDGDPDQPGDEGDPDQPGDEGDPDQPGDQGDPDQPGDEGDPDQPGEQGGPGDGGQPGEPGQGGKGGQPGDPADGSGAGRSSGATRGPVVAGSVVGADRGALPRTGFPIQLPLLVAGSCLVAGAALTGAARRTARS